MTEITDEQRRAYAEALARIEAAQDGLRMALMGEGCPPEVTAVASVLGMNPDRLWTHVEGVHGREPHDEGYEDAVWAAAGCEDVEHLKASI